MNTDYDSAFKRKEALPYVTASMKLDVIMLSEII